MLQRLFARVQANALTWTQLAKVLAVAAGWLLTGILMMMMLMVVVVVPAVIMQKKPLPPWPHPRQQQPMKPGGAWG